MHFGAKVERVKWKNLRIKGAIEVAHREVKVSHLSGNNIPFIIFLDVSKVPDGPTAGSKEVCVLGLAVEVSNSQCYDPPLFLIKRCKDCVDTCFNASKSLRSTSDFALKGLYHVAPLLKGCRRVAQQVSNMIFAFNSHLPVAITG